MANVTVKQFADVLGVPVDRLLTQLSEAGLQKKDIADQISDDEKMQLLQHLRQRHGKAGEEAGAAPKKISLKRKTVSELALEADKRGRISSPARKTVTVEVRKRRTYVKRGAEEMDVLSPIPSASAAWKKPNKPSWTRPSDARVRWT